DLEAADGHLELAPLAAAAEARQVVAVVAHLDGELETGDGDALEDEPAAGEPLEAPADLEPPDVREVGGVRPVARDPQIRRDHFGRQQPEVEPADLDRSRERLPEPGFEQDPRPFAREIGGEEPAQTEEG